MMLWEVYTHQQKVRQIFQLFIAAMSVLDISEIDVDLGYRLMGMTFKEDCPDVRNSLPVDIFRWLKEYGLTPKAADPVADREDFARLYDYPLSDISEVKDADCLVFLVRHACFRRLTEPEIAGFFRRQPDAVRVIIDVKSMFSAADYRAAGYRYWSL